MKLLLNMIEENRKHIETERSKAVIDLKNMAEITNWENRMKTDDTTIAKFYSSCVKLHKSQKLKLLTKNEEEFNVPVGRKSMKYKLDEQNAEDSEDEFKFQVKETGSEIRAEKQLKKKIKKNKKKNSQQ